MMLTSRKSYSLEFRLNAVKQLKENNGAVSGTAKLLGIDRRNLQRWRDDAARLQLTRKSRSCNSRHVISHISYNVTL